MRIPFCFAFICGTESSFTSAFIDVQALKERGYTQGSFTSAASCFSFCAQVYVGVFPELELLC